ncbi:hypothetical protein BC830DRAFT_1142346 [Chytriomyces sp. MP71]|nr:hypothetical protein BC830DRAFT_1142346 [Chytriomyces sp. MP71]
MTGHDAILSRSRNLLQLVLVVADVASSTQSPTNSKYSSVTPDLIKAALELCVAKYGLDEQSRSVQAEISEVVVSRFPR